MTENFGQTNEFGSRFSTPSSGLARTQPRTSKRRESLRFPVTRDAALCHTGLNG